MSGMLDGEARTGHVSPDNPPALVLATGIEDGPWVQLLPEHDRYAAFAWVRQVQDAWSDDEHGAFWRAFLPLWPRKRGNRAHVERLAWWFWQLRRRGASNAEAAGALGYDADALRRMGVANAGVRRAAQHAAALRVELSAADMETMSSDLVARLLHDQWTRLADDPRRRAPRVVTHEEGDEALAVFRSDVALAALPLASRRRLAATDRLGMRAIAEFDRRL